MRILHKTARKGWVGLTALLLAAFAWPTPALVRSLVGSVSHGGSPTRASESAAAVGTPEPASLVRLSAGERFDDRNPPNGWSDLVLSSIPTLAAGDLDTLSERAFKSARRVRLAIMANIVRTSNGGGHRLDRVGVGLSTPAANGGEVIVTPGDVGDSKESWSVADRIILAAGAYELSRAELIAATPTFAAVRMPTLALVADAHESVRLVHVFLVDPATGRLRTFTWWETGDQPARNFTEFRHPVVLDSPLHVKAKRLAGIAVAWSFAMIHEPEGIERAVTPELARWIAPDSIETANPRAIEQALIDAAKP